MNQSLLEPKGFISVAKNVGIKAGRLDFAVVASTVPATASAMFTRSNFCGAAVTVGREHLADGHVQATVVLSGNANVATGGQGIKDIREITRTVGSALGLPPSSILPAATGVIGRRLPMDTIQGAISTLSDEFVEGGLSRAAEAMITTDKRPKTRSVRIGSAVLFGMAKGAAMLEPNMATMLAFFYTDAGIEAGVLEKCLREAVDQSFNRISIDSDTSTSDTVAIIANGCAGPVSPSEFSAALTNMAIGLAKDMVREGEGATKLIEVLVEEARDEAQAARMGKSIINSPLVKTAVFGTDPNWGRVAMAIGKCVDDEIDPARVIISFGGLALYDQGTIRDDEAALRNLRALLSKDEITIGVKLGNGPSSATVWGCDLSYEYVRLNAEYTT